MIARMHHYVPQFYLKGFAEDREKPMLAVFDGATRKRFEAPPSKVAVERDFHRIEVDGHPPDALEKAFAAFESDASNAMARIAAARSIVGGEDLIYVLNLVALMACKNPRLRATINRFQANVLKGVLAMCVRSEEAWKATLERARACGASADAEHVGYDEMRDFVHSSAYDIPVPTTESLQLELGAFEVVLRTLSDRKWALLKAPPGSAGFITSDHPVCLMWSDPAMRRGPQGPGLGLRKTEVLFPISNELALVGAFESTPLELDADERMIAAFNAAVIAHAERQVYARSGDFVYTWRPGDRVRSGAEFLNDRHFGRPRPNPRKVQP